MHLRAEFQRQKLALGSQKILKNWKKKSYFYILEPKSINSFDFRSEKSSFDIVASASSVEYAPVEFNLSCSLEYCTSCITIFTRKDP